MKVISEGDKWVEALLYVNFENQQVGEKQNEDEETKKVSTKVSS